MSPPPIGLAGTDPHALRERVLAAWDEFLDVAAGADLSAPSRLPGWRGSDVCVHLGAWEGGAPLSGAVAAARSGRTGRAAPSTIGNEHIVDAHRHESRAAVLAALRRSRDAVDRVFTSGDAQEVGRRFVPSPVGPLPVLTLVGTAGYELAVHALDLAPCGAPAPSAALLSAGLAALVDVTGALAARHGIEVAVAAQTPAGGWRFTSSAAGWLTWPTAAGPVPGTAVLGAAADLLDVSAGRTPLVPMLVRRRVRVHGLPAFLRLAPLVEAVPGLPGAAALRTGAAGLAGAGRLLERLPGLGRPAV